MTDSQTAPAPGPSGTSGASSELLAREVAHLEQQIARRFASERELLGEQFGSVQRQLELAEERRLEQKADAAAAVAVSIAATREAFRDQRESMEKSAAKAEALTAAQLEQLGEAFRAGLAALTDAVADLKDRVVALESARRGGFEQRNELRSSSSLVIGAAGIALTVVIVVLTVVTIAKK